jgi:hypothetical protein
LCHKPVQQLRNRTRSSRLFCRPLCITRPDMAPDSVKTHWERKKPLVGVEIMRPSHAP